jgi:hypothetical protein
METPGESLTDEREPDRAVPPDAPVETPEADPRTKGAPGGPGSTSERDEEERWGLVADADERAADGTRMMDQPARRSRGTKKTTAKRFSAKRSTAKRPGPTRKKW